jgi:hypothetical protein
MTLQTITELLKQFSRDEGERYVYRGQSRSYPTLIPSAYRNLTEPVPNDPGAFQIPRARVIAERTRRQDEQSRLRAFWVQRFGMQLGNLLAQQYLVHSDVIDVTTDPVVAAFFATHKGAACRPIDSASEPGVILRWKKPDPNRTVRELRQDMTLGMLHPWKEDARISPIPTKYSFVVPGTAEYLKVRDEPNSFLVLRPDICSPTEIRTILSANVDREKGHIHPHHWMFEYFPTSRWAAQSGCMIRPTYRYPAHMTIEGSDFVRGYDPELDMELFTNLRVSVGMPDRVADAYNLGPPERYEFRHSTERIELARETLWPSAEQDLMFLAAACAVWVESMDYLDEIYANFPWEPQGGVLDRGFYPEFPDEAYRRQEWDLFNKLRQEPPAAFRNPPGVSGERSEFKPRKEDRV